MNPTVERESLHNSFRNILEEARMILPGTQTLFGFQLIVVFTEYFHRELTDFERYVHFSSMVLTLISFAIILTLTAYHRYTPIDYITRDFVKLGNRLLRWGMFPLVAAICLDFFIVSHQTFDSDFYATLSAFLIFMLLISLWYLMPYFNGRKILNLEKK